MTDLLANVEIASPCRADWGAMTGDDRRRFCADCKLHVHDLTAMTRDEAEALLRAAAGGRLCVRFHRRADGRVLTRDCPVGLRRRLRTAWARAAALACALWAAAAACVRSGGGCPATMRPVEPEPGVPGEAVMGRRASPEPSAMGEFVMGDFAAPGPTPAPPQPPAPRAAIR